MSTNKEQVLNYILKLISAKEKKLVSKVVETFNGDISKSSVYNYVKELCDDGVIQKTNSAYELVSKIFNFSYKNSDLSEDKIFLQDIAPLLNNYGKNVFSAWNYGFTEMMNNAIEHSLATKISVTVCINALKTTISIVDNGIGIFKNIQEFMQNDRGKQLSLKECADLLFAGKFTTAKSLHSGEGIFFTSHLMDDFCIISDKIIFARSNFADKMDDLLNDENGTAVYMSLSNNSKKTTREVFERFSNVDDGFIKTQIPIAHIFAQPGPISRSEARRLGELIFKFREVDLDFAGVEEVGQAFSHELFIVWQNRNPEIALNILNANEAVLGMINRVKNTK